MSVTAASLSLCTLQAWINSLDSEVVSLLAAVKQPNRQRSVYADYYTDLQWCVGGRAFISIREDELLTQRWPCCKIGTEQKERERERERKKEREREIGLQWVSESKCWRRLVANSFSSCYALIYWFPRMRDFWLLWTRLCVINIVSW